MTTTTITRRIPVNLARTASEQYRRLVTALTNYRRDTGRVLAVHCPTCRTWVKPKRYIVTAGTCCRCAHNRNLALYEAARTSIHRRRPQGKPATQNTRRLSERTVRNGR